MKELLDDHLFSKNEEDYQSYRTFLNVAEAKVFCELLDKKEVAYKLESSGTVIDAAIVGDGFYGGIVCMVLEMLLFFFWI